MPMPTLLPEPIRRIRDRPLLLARQEELAAELLALDAEQQRLAERYAELRREIESLHAILWPATPGYEYRKTRRPPVPGPTHLPPPRPDSVALRGRALRRAVLEVLANAGTPLRRADVHRALHLSGRRLTAKDPVKQLADALAYEERNGRVRRVARGTYQRA
jgi:hypothetical protein